jgi:hypothetical protein
MLALAEKKFYQTKTKKYKRNQTTVVEGCLIANKLEVKKSGGWE